MYMLNMVIILIVMYSNVVTAIDKIPTYLLRFNTFMLFFYRNYDAPLSNETNLFFSFLYSFYFYFFLHFV